MISPGKLCSLKEGTRQRKIIRILGNWEKELAAGQHPDPHYYCEFIKIIKDEEAFKAYGNHYSFIVPAVNDEGLGVFLNRLRHEFLSVIGISPSEWDLINPSDIPSREGQPAFPLYLYLDDIRSPFNIGSIFRTALCFGVQEIWLSPGCADPEHPRALRSAMGCIESMSWRRMGTEELKNQDNDIFAMELGGKDVEKFQFPPAGIMVLGSEEIGVSPECLVLAKQSRGTVSIGLYGNKASLNVSVAFGIAIKAWTDSLPDVRA